MPLKTQKRTYKPMEYYLALPWNYIVQASGDEQEPWTVRVRELPGCMSHGVGPVSALQDIPEAIESYILALQATGEEVPEPINPSDFKGVITYRTTPERHYYLAQLAQNRQTSVNKVIDSAIEKVLAE